VLIDVQGFSGGLESAARARVHALHALDGQSAVADRVASIVTELATNAIRHGGGAFFLRLSIDESELLVEVRDWSLAPPVPVTPSNTDPRGRGLMIVGAMASRWGYRPEVDGKTVWAALDVCQRLRNRTASSPAQTTGHQRQPANSVESSG
jgi:anti-sigma regulatory factor (Ser/Thr protein kinase)